MTYLFNWLLTSTLLTLMMEMIKFQSIKKTFNFAKKRPDYFAVNLLIVSATLSISFLVTRQMFLGGFVTLFWLILAVTNAIVTHLRGYPLMFSDIFLIKEGLSLSSHYFKPWIIAILVLVLAFFIRIGYDWYQVKVTLEPLNYMLALLYVTFAAFTFNRIEKGQFADSVSDTSDEIGFAYAMADSIYPYINRKPEQYDEGVMLALLNGLKQLKSIDEMGKPTLIMLQLESFFDPFDLSGVTFSCDPIPTLRQLMKLNRNGTLHVPTFGGGTAKTEFSVLTSMNAELLKPGEIPHNSFLKQQPVASLATTLNQLGYHSTVIHNYEGNFYNRHLAYANLGFSRYIPIEFMSGIDRVHDLSQMNDGDLIDYVLKVLETDAQPFIYGITAGTHQPYDETTYDDTHPIQVDGDISLEMKCALQNYAKRVHALDCEIKRLIHQLETMKDEVVLVMFSDHLPNLPILSDSNRYDKDPFNVSYFIYQNKSRYPIDVPPYLEAYHLVQHLMHSLKMPLDLMQQIHDTYQSDSDYQEILRLVQYDLLEGHCYLTNQHPFCKHSILEFGLNELQLKMAKWCDEGLLVTGFGFNIDSQLYVDHRKVETVYVNEQQLLAKLERKEWKLIQLKQLSGHHQALGCDYILTQEHDIHVDNKF